MKKIIFVVLIFIFLLDYSFFPFLFPTFPFKIHFTIIFLTALFLTRPFFESMGWAVLGGALIDYSSTLIFGLSTILILTLVLIFDLLRKKLLPTDLKIPALFLIFFCSQLFFEGLLLLLLSVFGMDEAIQSVFNSPLGWLQALLVKALFSIVGIFFYKFIKKAGRFFGEEALRIEEKKI